jgi:uncharacterized membrane protein HdeD (DUF308 family)
MKKIIPNKFTSTKHWYLPMVVGILMMLFGIYILNIPHKAYVVMVTFFSIAIIVMGISELIFYLSNQMRDKELYLGGAVVVIISGLFLLFNPSSTAFVIALFIAFQLIIRSAQGLIFSFTMKDAKVENWYLLTITSSLGIVLALVLAAHPMIVKMSLVILSGMSFIFAGIIGIASSIVLKRANELIEQVNKNGSGIADADYEIVEDK